jgi:hypothetical protein
VSRGKGKVFQRQAVTWPFPPPFKEALTMAIQCLEQYAKKLSVERAMNG